MTYKLGGFVNDLKHELLGAENAHGPMHSPHEAYGVILEELDEFWDEVRKKQPAWNRMRKELLQTAAMCWRACKDLGLEE